MHTYCMVASYDGMKSRKLNIEVERSDKNTHTHAHSTQCEHTH